MLIQLGNKRFEGLFTPNGISYSGNEANLAQYDLIGTKPRLQFTGETLQTVTVSFKLRIEFCNPDQEIKDFEKWKSDSEVLPLLLGNGEYINDYVISGVEKTINQTFDDGTIIDAGVTINLLEFVPFSKDEQQAATDRRNAAAVGDKQQIARRPVQAKTSEAEAHTALLKAENEAWEAANLADQAQNDPTPERFIDKINTAVDKAQKSMSNAKQKISDAQQQINNATGIISSVENAGDKLRELKSLMKPPISLYNLGQAVTNLQLGLGGIDTNVNVFNSDVILRRI